MVTVSVVVFPALSAAEIPERLVPEVAPMAV
jgi:hypothetical protein